MEDSNQVLYQILLQRLELLRTLDKEGDSAKRRHVAQETKTLHAPLAHRLGLYQIKTEMEDLSLKFLDYTTYKYIAHALNEKKSERDAYIQQFITPLQEKLTAAGFRFTIKGRPKSIHSIYHKMQVQHCDVDRIYDLFAIRIILDSELSREKQDCWQVYSIITDMYQPNPKRLRDWLSVPKENGYESLHTTVLGPENKWVEVQIRTIAMDFWASLEHQLRYKKDVEFTEAMANELLYCAKLSAELDAKMDALQAQAKIDSFDLK